MENGYPSNIEIDSSLDETKEYDMNKIIKEEKIETSDEVIRLH